MFRIILVTVVLFGTLVCGKIPLPIRQSSEPLAEVDPNISYRLPNTTRPDTYDVRLVTRIDQNQFNFEGTVEIVITVVNSTSIITLHHRQLTINDVKLVAALNVDIPLKPIEYDNITEHLTISLLQGNLDVNSKYTLKIAFNGTLTSYASGFYRVSYKASDGSTRWLATTQFESTNARHGFPCYDEPSFRANFTIRITHGKSYNAISNMPAIREPTDNLDGTVTTFFETTPLTPTYLIAYVISDYYYISNANLPNVLPHRVYSRPDYISSTNYSLEVGINVLKAFENHFQIPFALPKMDQIAIPEFGGAMENWGLVTYGEGSLLLFDYSTFSRQRGIVSIIAHEFAHQWFGNLVTPKWWSYIWLNEGFATLFAAYGSHWVYPEWKVLDFYVCSTMQNVFKPDAEKNVRPMTYYVEDQTNVANLFDDIAYSKSGTVLRMILHAFTESTFLKGLTYYLNEKSYSAAVEEDLFAGLERAVIEDKAIPADLKVSDIMISWTRQSGFPVLHVIRNYENGAITLTQERYYTEQTNEIDSTTWWIPFNFATANNSDFTKTTPDGWIPKGNRSQIVQQTNTNKWTNDDWVVFNKRATGYYRVRYDERNYGLIADELNNGSISQIHLTSRSQIIDDAFEFSKRGRLNYTIVFNLIKYLHAEQEYVPWASAFNGLSDINRLLAGSKEYSIFQNFTQHLVKHLFHYTGVEDIDNEYHFNKQLRIQAINWACSSGLSDCLNATNVRLNDHLTSGNEIHQNIRGTIYCNGIRSDNTAEAAQLWNLLPKTTNSEDRDRIILALGCSLNETYLNDLLKTTIAPGSIYNSQAERYRVFTGVTQNGQLGLKVSITFMLENFDNIMTQYGAGYTRNTIGEIARYVVNDSVRAEFNKLIDLAKNKPNIDAGTITRALATVETNMKWLTSYQPTIEAWIKEHSGPNGANTLIVSFVLLLVGLFVSRFNFH